MNAISAILELETHGFIFSLENKDIRYSHSGDRPDQGFIRERLLAIKENKEEAISYLSQRNIPFDIASHLFAQAEKAMGDEDLDRWIQLIEAASLERSKSYAKNDYDRRRCPNCPHLGQGPLYELDDYLVLCDTPCPVSS